MRAGLTTRWRRSQHRPGGRLLADKTETSEPDNERIRADLVDARGYSAYAVYALDVPAGAFTVQERDGSSRTQSRAWLLDADRAAGADVNGPLVAAPPWDPPADDVTIAFSMNARNADGFVCRLGSPSSPDGFEPDDDLPVLELYLQTNRYVLAISHSDRTRGMTVARSEPSESFISGQWRRCTIRVESAAVALFVDGRRVAELVYEDSDLPTALSFPAGPELVFGGQTSRAAVSRELLSFRVREVRMWDAPLEDAAVARDAELRRGRPAGQHRSVRVNWGSELASYGDWTQSVDPSLYLIEEYRLSYVPGATGLGQLIVFETTEDDESIGRPVGDMAAGALADLPNLTRSSPDHTTRRRRLIETDGCAPTIPATWARTSVEGGVAGLAAERGRVVRRVLDDLIDAVKAANQSQTLDTSYIRRPIRPSRAGAPTSVLRQLNQRYAAFVHLVDIRVGYGESLAESIEVPLDQVDDLLKDVVTDGFGTEAGLADEIRALLGGSYSDLPTLGTVPGVVGVDPDDAPLVDATTGMLTLNGGRKEIVRLDTGSSVVLEGWILDGTAIVLETPEVIQTKIGVVTAVSSQTGASLEVEELAALHLQNQVMRARLDLVASGEMPLEQMVDVLRDTAQPGPIDLTAFESPAAVED